MKNPTLLFLFVLIFCLEPHAIAQKKQDKRLATTLDKVISTRFAAIAPGCVVLVAKKGEVTYKRAFGQANLELKIPMRPDMIFRVGSLTKQFTAIAILQLVEQGKIALHDSIQKYVPDYPFKGYPITIENLLTQTSRIKDYMAIVNPAGERSGYTPKQGVDYFKNEPLEFKPGTQFRLTRRKDIQELMETWKRQLYRM